MRVKCKWASMNKEHRFRITLLHNVLCKKAIFLYSLKYPLHTRPEFNRINHVFYVIAHVDLSLKCNDMLSLMCDYEEDCIAVLRSYDLRGDL